MEQIQSKCKSCTAIILAGGLARRMKQDKRFMPVGEMPMLERQVDFLSQYFENVIISANDPERLAYLGVPVIPDRTRGRGPLEGLTSALAVSHSEFNFVVAVDIPDIDMKLVEKMRSKLDDVSAVIPISIDDKIEPLFGFYSQACVPIFRTALASGERAIHMALQKCPTYYFPLPANQKIGNLNSPTDYEAYVRRSAGKAVH